MSAAGTSVVAAIGAALVPKCPVCVAALLSSLGLGVAVAEWVAPFARPTAMGVTAAALAALGWLEWRRRRTGACGTNHRCQAGAARES